MVDRTRRRAAAAALAGVALLAGAAACAPVSGDSSGGGAGHTVTVFAAASLTEPFRELGERFEDRHDGTEVEFNFAGSSRLAQQINGGAPADVFATADTRTMDRVADNGLLAGEAEVFATNTLRVAVPPDNPAGVTELSDLADDGTTVALCAEEVPCGAAAAEVMDASGVRVTPDSEERDVKAALTKVELGEVDAALVYASDVAAAGGGVRGIDFDAADEAVNEYPVAPLDGSGEPDLARQWADFVRSGTGARVLDDAGFGTV
ncbi:molybdate transport system substrate-binding protein [Haloactinospora alba]|uniref:Molybdate transport system substrate-binding protein n=1 Tax=Haloactinospora alba TaxID=405555 RepID=A0A543N7P5_9ACTN|nr:molybdate ABC transporter substrate-binding protein [Haloactinospora alba]TQN27827.1 molybdate transport system substrate-binding protein [Haloactinospora alba]